MRGIGLKDHTGETTGAASVLNDLFADEATECYGTITLNPANGGWNPWAVAPALRKGARIVWMGTYGTRRHREIWGRGPFDLPAGDVGVTLYADGGGLFPEVEELLERIRAFDAVLATGHLAPEESIALFRRAKEMGIGRLMLTHASEEVTAMPVDQQREIVALGGWIEHCFMGVTEACPGHIPLEALAEQARAIGVEHVILTSDFGQVGNGPIVPGFADYLGRLMALGFTQAEVRAMVVDHPAALMEG